MSAAIRSYKCLQLSLKAAKFLRDCGVGLAVGQYEGVKVLEVGVTKAALLRDGKCEQSR